ncbi:MAG: phosphate/phosphite/phosphonate ABC transporter substrate-binding protein [Betaproteobacteria bacterium]|nr:phosphate/phosphite/phosphonate ABC transporter substrate-binding protein [Betaproteobacteria bacterium]
MEMDIGPSALGGCRITRQHRRELLNGRLMGKKMTHLVKSILGSLCGAVLMIATNNATAQGNRIYSFAVVPQYSATELHKEWTPVLQRISRDTGIALELRIAASIPKFEAEFLKGTPDFAYMNPYHAVMAKQAHAYLPILRDSQPLSGILLARRDGAYQSIRDLNGQTIAFPAPNAFGASLYMRALLAEDAGIKIEPRYVKTHSNVYRHVIRKDVAAGGSVNAAFNDEVPEVREQLRIIYQTPEVASHPVVVHPRVPHAVSKAIAEIFLALGKDEGGRALLKDIRTPRPVAANYERDYLPLEKLNIRKYLMTEKE